MHNTGGGEGGRGAGERALAECPDAYIQLNARAMFREEKRKKRRKKKGVTPVRWSGLISEISSVKKFHRVLLSLPLFLHGKCTYTRAVVSLSLCLSPAPPTLLSLAPSATRESPGFINVRHYRFSRGIAFLFLSLPSRYRVQ